MSFFKWLNYKRPSFESLLTRQFADPERLCAYVARHVRYKADPKERDHWQTPEETWKRGLGDCEDLAVLVGHLAQARGFGVALAAAFSAKTRTGHVYAHGVHLNRQWVYSNNEFKWTRWPTETPFGFVRAQTGMPAEEASVFHMPLMPETIAAMLTKAV